MTLTTLNTRRTIAAPATQVVTSVVMCGCPVWTPFGWMLVWRTLVKHVEANSTARAEYAHRNDYLNRYASAN